MKTLNTPLPVNENTVISSEYDEVQTKARRKRKPHRTRSDHKHKYETAYCEDHFKSYIDGRIIKTHYRIEYCTQCGRVNKAQYILSADDIPVGAKVFRTPVDNGGYAVKFIPDLSDYFFYKE